MKLSPHCAAITASLLLGCAAPYKPPVSGPTAELTFYGPGGAFVNKEGAGEACSAYEFVARNPVGGITITVPAGKELWLGHSIPMGAASNCRTSFTLIPEAGAKYESRITTYGLSCRATLHEVSRSIPVEPALAKQSRWPLICQLPG